MCDEAIDNAVEVLNRALENDPDAMLALINVRVKCNEKMVNDPTIQVGTYREYDPSFGILGLINGLFGTRDSGGGYIAADCDIDENYNITKIIGFRRLSENLP